MIDTDVLSERFTPWLAARLGSSFSGISDIRSASNGFSAETMFASVDGPGGTARDIVLRLEQPGEEIFLNTQISRQAAVMEALVAAGIPAPRVIGLEADGDILGHPFIAMERSPGRTFPQTPNYMVAGWVKDLSSHRRQELWDNALTMLGRVNSLGPEDGLAFLNSPQYGSSGLQQYLGWVEAWRESSRSGREHPLIDVASHFLWQHQPSALPVNFIWGDANPCNMLFNSDLSVSAILDFEAASLGPAEVDLGWWLFLDRTRVGNQPLLEGVPDRNQCIAIYEKALGRETQAVDYFEIMGGLRMVLVIVRTVNRLVAMGELPPDTDAAEANPISGALAELLGLPSPPPGEGFQEFIGAVTRSKA